MKKQKNKDPQPENFPHFRFYQKARHPALVTGEHEQDEYKYRKVTHSNQENGRNNEKVDPNPNAKDSKPMFIVKRVRHDKKTNFSRWKYPWKYLGK